MDARVFWRFPYGSLLRQIKVHFSDKSHGISMGDTRPLITLVCSGGVCNLLIDNFPSDHGHRTIGNAEQKQIGLVYQR